jgi:DNA-binding IclR family transcriptional regulator
MAKQFVRLTLYIWHLGSQARSCSLFVYQAILYVQLISSKYQGTSAVSTRKGAAHVFVDAFAHSHTISNCLRRFKS